MRTHYENWSVVNIVGHIVSTAVILLPTAGCAAALWLQQARGIPQWREANLAECNRIADAATARPDEAGAPTSVDADSPWLRGLRDDLRGSEPAREAFAVCMDKRSNAYATVGTGRVSD